MQTVAEEKRKAYRCVCWSSEPVGPETLQVREEQEEENAEGERERKRERERSVNILTEAKLQRVCSF
jgi:hypothetical protein